MSDEKTCRATADEDAIDPSRRKFMRAAGGTLAGVAAASLFAGCDAATRERLFRRHFKELDKQSLAAALENIEADYREKFGTDISVAATAAQEDVLFGYALDLGRCIGCRRCVYACVEENNQSRSPEIQWIRVLEMDKGPGLDILEGNAYYDPETVPEEGKFYLPIQCQQCQDPPCVKSCPTEATWQEKDGIVVVDYDWCIGCRSCMSACPYGARHFNWGEPVIPTEEINTKTHYLGNRPRPVGVVEKCTFCIQRTREGRYPACLEACPVGARKFGNLLDPASEVRQVLDRKRVFVLKEELNTKPKFFYYFGEQ